MQHGPVCVHACIVVVMLRAMHVVILSRGIDVVRNKIKMFAQHKVTLPKGRHKMIILDEADRCVTLFTLVSWQWMWRAGV